MAVTLASLTLLACSSNASSTQETDPTAVPDATDVPTTLPAAEESSSTDAPEPTTSAEDPASPTTAEIDGASLGIVARAGSVESVLTELPEASNFSAGVEAWLGAVPGQEGVLRNDRGITLFVPIDDGFSGDVLDEAFADADISAKTIGEHLVVGVVDPIEGTVVTAAGSSHEVTDGPTVGGRRVIRTETASNGVIHLIDGPLAPAVS